MYQHQFSREVTATSLDNGIVYSICTLVTRPADYEAMICSMLEKGFHTSDCEYLYVDNTSEQQTDGYFAIRKLLTSAVGRYIIICHQDVEFVHDGRAELDRILEALTQSDPNWAVCGNAGARGPSPNDIVCRISDPHGKNRSLGVFPSRVLSLDENFLVLRRSALAPISRDLSGFHLYGTDVCLLADILGYSSYVVDFHLEHKSPGRMDASFSEAEARFAAAYKRKLRSRWAHTTCTTLYVSKSPFLGIIFNNSISRRVLRRLGILAPGLSKLLYGN